MKLLGVIFALILLFLPLSMHLEATNNSSETISTLTPKEEESKGRISTFIKKMLTRMEIAESPEAKSEYSEVKSRLEGFHKKIEGLLKKLNNTES